MSLKKYSFNYKFKSIGGPKSLLSRAWVDLYLSIFVSIFYLIIVKLEIYNLNWWKDFQPNTAFALTPIMVFLGLMAFVFNLKRSVIANTLFNKKLEKNDLLSPIEFYYDFSMRLLLLLIIIWLLFVIAWFMFSNFKVSFMSENILIAYLFVVPIFLFSLSIINVYYCYIANELYTRLEIEYSN
jgi:hypothetical protein